LLFPLGLVFLACSTSSLILVYFNVVSYAFQFNLFLFAIVSLAFSLLCLAVDITHIWLAEEPRPYYPRVPLLEPSERPLVVTTKNPQKGKTTNVHAHVEPPSREELQRLKEVLNIEKGSLQFKRRGSGIYLVTYEHGKYCWRHLGSWIQLKEKLERENSV
jgi:hypothetical protein